ncbi:radical SAM protein, partial [bacterium]|nr:radical SAM protein [candidate division CSSED10-310 bacterium]
MKLSKMLYRWPFSFILKSPYTCNIKITQRCNLRCSFCNLWQKSNLPELYLENYRTIADILLDAGLARIVITGGEPFLREDLPEIIALFARRGFSTTLLTNGTLASFEKLQKLHDLGLNDIGVSLDTLDSKKQAKICGFGGVWEKAVATIRNCVSLFNQGFVEVLITVSGDNIKEIPDLVDFVHYELGAWSVINPVNIPPFPGAHLSAPPGNNAPPLPAEIVDEVYDSLRQ